MCPEENVLVDFVQGTLDKAQRAALEAHIDECDACSLVVAQMAVFVDASADRIPRVASPEPDADSDTEPPSQPEPSQPQPWSPREDTEGAFSPSAVTQPTGEILVEPAAQLPQGATLGRYVVIDRVGAGGMGVVYSAYDPELDRRVALKVLRGGPSMHDTTSRGDKRRDRLMREAQAMAKLAHANVITVHDVGTFEDRVFLAMEFIEGQTLGDWMKERQRPWREVIPMFVAAGRGLAAAHAIDLVHRDFKPDNVLIGSDGRVLVTDFGLARPAAGKTGSFSAVGEIPSQQVLTASLTQTGALVGTPAYMAPEQLSGSRTSPLTDQFSFCVALHEALFGRRPFTGSNFAELASNLVSGSFVPPPRDISVPRRIRRAVFRGLSADPDERFESMEALLAELAHDPWRSRRRYLVLGIPAAVAVTAGAVALVPRPEARYCEDIEQRLAGIWDQSRKEALDEAFIATEVAFADDARTTTRRRLDEYAAQWVDLQGAACRDQVSGEQPQAVLALRMHCLDRGRHALEAVTDLLVEADAAVVEGAIDATRSLPTLAICEDLDALTRSVPPPPQDLELRGTVETIERQIAEARALREAGKYDETEGLARGAQRKAQAIGYGPAEAEATAVLATTLERKGKFDEAEDLYHQALSTAMAAGHSRVIAEASVGLVWLTGEPSRPLKEAERWSAHGLAALDPMGGQPELEAQLNHSLAVARLNHGEFDLAQKALDRVIEVREAAFGKAHHSLGAAMSTQGQLMAMTQRLEPAIEAFRTAHRHMVHEYGEHHPLTATVIDNLAVALSQSGRYDEARSLQLQALKIREQSLGPAHPEVAWSHLNMAATLDALDDPQSAHQHAEKAHEIFAKVFGPRSLEITSALTNMGVAEHRMGKLESARTRHELALQLATEHLGAEHPKVGKYNDNLAGTLVDLGLFELALQHYETALRITEASRGPEHPLIADICASLAQLYGVSLDRPDDAVPYAERAVRIVALHPDNRELRGVARFALANVLWDATRHRDRARAHTMAKLARDDFAADGTGAKNLAAADKWLAEHPAPQ